MLLLATTALAPTALAAAYYFVDSGNRAIGRGGAMVVGADDQSAQFYNPAALKNVDYPTLGWDGWIVRQSIYFDRADEEGLDAFEPVENNAPPMKEPQLGFVMPLGNRVSALKNTTLAVGFYVPTSPTLSYPADGAQRYALVDSLVWQAFAGPSIAQEVTPWLTLGLGLQYTFLRVEEGINATICYTAETCATGSDDPASDLALQIKTWDKKQFSFNAGFIVTPLPWLEVGASVQPPIKYEAPGTMHASFSEDYIFAEQLASLESNDEAVLLKVQTPLQIRSGVQVSPNEKLRVEADFVWTDWSAMEELRVTDLDLIIDAKDDASFITQDIEVHDDVVFVTGYVDAWSLRLGGDWRFNEHAQVRAGGYFETSAVPADAQGVNVVDGDKWGLGAGATFTVKKRLDIDVSGGEQFLGSRTISDSTLRQQALLTETIAPYPTEVTTGKVVGNGEFRSSLTFLSVGLKYRFGKAAGKVASNDSYAGDESAEGHRTE